MAHDPITSLNSRKMCTACRELKDIDEFHRNKRAADRHASQCKICKKQISNDKNRSKRKPRIAWKESERDDILEGLSRGWSNQRIASFLPGRTVTAVILEIQSRKIRTSKVRWHRTLTDMARLFGRSVGLIGRWVANGWIKPVGDVVKKTGHPVYFTDDALSDFLEHRPAWPTWSPEQITDPLWREIAQEYRDAAGGRWLSTLEVAEQLRYGPSTVSNWIRKGQLKAIQPYPHRRDSFVWSADLEEFIPPVAGRKAGVPQRRRMEDSETLKSSHPADPPQRPRDPSAAPA